MGSSSPINRGELLQLLLGLLSNVQKRTDDTETNEMVDFAIEMVWKLLEDEQGKSISKIVAELPAGTDFIPVTNIITEILKSESEGAANILDAGIPMFFGNEEGFRGLVLAIKDSFESLRKDLVHEVVWQIANYGTYGLELGLLFPRNGKPILESTLSSICERIEPLLDLVVPYTTFSIAEYSEKSVYQHKIIIHFPGILQENNR